MPAPDTQSTDHYPPSWWSRNRLKLLRPLVTLLVAASLVWIANAITPAQCWVVFMAGCLVAWPIWQYRMEYLLFRRRLVLSAAGQPASKGRALFWKGTITKVIQVVVSLVIAWLLLGLVSRLSIWHGRVLMIDAVLLAMIAGPVTRSLNKEIKQRYVAVIARRWPLFIINGVLLTVAFMALDFYVVGAEDTRYATWYQVAEHAYKAVNDAAGCVLWGAIVGGLAAIESVWWHFSELYIPGMPDVSSQLILWSLFLLRAAAVAWLFTTLLLGVIALLDKSEKRRQGAQAESIIPRVFMLTIIFLALPFLYVAFKVTDTGVPGPQEPIDVVCESDEEYRARLIDSMSEEVSRARLNSIQVADAKIDQGMKNIFKDVEARVDDYLDWYFTVTGEYQRLAAAIATDASTAMREKLEAHLFTDSRFAARLDELDGKVASESIESFVHAGQLIGNQVAGSECDYGQLDLGQLSSLDNEMLRASVAVTGGVGTGIVATKVLAQKTTAAVVGKVAAKKSFQAGAALVTKALAKKGTSAALSAGAGAAICAPTGFVAVLCGITAGVVTWFTVDKGIIEIDEALNRDEMRADILKVLEEQRVELGEKLKIKHHRNIDRLAAGVNRFIPAENM